jgi:hypothetical protein
MGKPRTLVAASICFQCRGIERGAQHITRLVVERSEEIILGSIKMSTFIFIFDFTFLIPLIILSPDKSDKQ